ncbi:MAG: succinate dehydrogenase, hydrophobic membrane anchor protein [Pseudomonadales bacterium]|nr:succinate dehydrogenase, hydrophobic membrane anchor protein [Pseudomonadales bacterium]
MVTATNLSRSGLTDWIVQRLTAVILALYVVVITGYFICTPEFTFEGWQAFMSCLPMKIFTLLAVISIAAHAWVGLWTIATDYIKPVAFRSVFLIACAIANFVYVVWAFQILWSV